MIAQRHIALHVLTALMLASVVVAQPLPDDAPLLPRWTERMRRADSLRAADRDAEAIDLLEELRGSPIVRARSEDYPRLLMTLARAYAMRGDIDRAFERVSEAMAAGYIPWRELATDDVFALVRGDSRFEKLIASARLHADAWDRLRAPPGPMLSWSDSIPLHLRLYGVSAIWAAVRHAYAYAERIASPGWDSVYLASLLEAQRAAAPVAYYRLLQEMAAALNDGHTGIELPAELLDSLAYYPPVRTELLGERVVIVGVVSPVPPSVTVRVGDEIVAIDGTATAEYVERYVAPWVSASTEQDRSVRCHDHFLLAGPVLSEVELTVVGADDMTRRVTLTRAWCRDDLVARATIESSRLGSDIGYIAVNTFSDEYVLPLFDATLARLGGVRGLVIDLRHNTGGHSRLALDLLARLMTGSFETHRWETPMYRAYLHGRGRAVEWYGEPAGCHDGLGRFTGPVVLLVGARTLSAAENFVVAFDYARRGAIVGEPTAGSTGHTLMVPLPLGGLFRVTTTRDYYPDGRVYNGHGVEPTIRAARTIDDVREGRDPVLDAGVRALESAILVRSNHTAVSDNR